MKIVSLINGSLLSQTVASYALAYAKELHLGVSFIYIDANDNLSDVKKSAQLLEQKAKDLELKSEFFVLDSLGDLQEYVESREIETMFCSTRHQHTILDKSFVKELIAQKIRVDLCVVKVVKAGYLQEVQNILLPIKEAKLSVKKFTLMMVFARAYNAKVEIYSLDKLSAVKLQKVTKEQIKQRLQEIIFKLRHYMKLFYLSGTNFSIKHDFALSDGESVKTHIAKHNYDLAIVGAHSTNSIFEKNHPIDVLFEHPSINTLYFIPYED